MQAILDEQASESNIDRANLEYQISQVDALIIENNIAKNFVVVTQPSRGYDVEQFTGALRSSYEMQSFEITDQKTVDTPIGPAGLLYLESQVPGSTDKIYQISATIVIDSEAYEIVSTNPLNAAEAEKSIEDLLASASIIE